MGSYVANAKRNRLQPYDLTGPVHAYAVVEYMNPNDLSLLSFS